MRFNRGRDGWTNFTWRIKKQATRLTPLFEHDDDDDDEDSIRFWEYSTALISSRQVPI
jgi:hypothetical protein